MTSLKRFTAAWLVILVLFALPTGHLCALGEGVGELTAYSFLDDISKHGNVYLETDRRLLLQDLEAAGIEPGDTVRVTFLDQSMDMPVGYNFSEAASGDVLLRIKDDGIELAINMDEFASKTIADRSVAADGTVTWTYKAGIEGPVAFHISLVEKGKAPGGDDSIRLVYTNARADYPNLSDAAFANIRMVATTGIGEGTLYRTSSPINPKIGRNTFADKALRMAGVRTVMNLADSREAAEGYEGYGESYYATIDTVELGMQVAFDTQEFRNGLAGGLRYFGDHEGPYAVHCLEGKDRTGVVAALLEGFMGATFDEVRRDYMETFYNFYGVSADDAAYDEIAENNIAATLRRLLGTDDLANTDLAAACESFFREIGLSDEELESLRTNLGRTWNTDRSKYASMENWAYFGAGADSDADIFIVGTTVDRYDEYNMTCDDKNRFRFTRALNMQKGLYEDSLRMFAPYYRQISFKAYELSREAREPYLKIAYGDVSEAFRYYLEHENRGRPIVLFGFSQGADHVYRLLKEYFGDEKLYKQLVAAYSIGWGCTYEEAEAYPQIVPAKGEDDVGCVVSYDVEAPEVRETLVTPMGERHFAINPLNWRTDATPADKALNKGAVFVTNDLEVTEVPRLCGAWLDTDRGVLKVADVDPAQYPARLDTLPEGAYHIYDLNFFWNNLKENIAVRLRAFQTQRQLIELPNAG